MARYSVAATEKMRQSRLEAFIAAAKLKFGSQFNYSKVEYVNQKHPVQIGCERHGSFMQTPDRHLQATFGCPACGIDSRATLAKDLGYKRFLDHFRARFSDKLELLTPYVSVKQPIAVRCKLHNETFETTPDSLNLVKHGCRKCSIVSRGNEMRLSQDEFIERAANCFGDQFDLSQVKYVHGKESVLIGCPIHGQFEIKPSNFLNSNHGCPKCGRLHTGYASERINKLESGLIKAKPTTLAVMRIEVFGITAFKLGVTNRRLIDRYAQALREVIFETTLDELDALKLEQHLHGKYFKARDVRIYLAGLRAGQRWSGDSEIYKEEYIEAILAELKAAVESLQTKDSAYWQRLPNLTPPILKIRSVRKKAGVYAVAKPVIRLDNLQTFSSATAAAVELGTTQSLVSMVCNGKRGETKGIKFAWLSDYKAGKLHSFIPRNKGARHTAARAVRCVETGVVYQTLTDAARAAGIDSSKVTLTCKGRRKTAGGFRWVYV